MMTRLPVPSALSTFAAMALCLLMSLPAAAQTGKPFDRVGWVAHVSAYSFDALNARLDAAIRAEKMGLVTQASASVGARSRGVDIPGNRVVGVYRNDFAVRMLQASLAAGIEAPIRFYVFQNPDGGATLSYKTPTHVFSPYFEEGENALQILAGELDQIFARIAASTVGP
ncbi:MAG: DUF302 domain-containing protein [Rhizobiaceae bacterium]|nr:DUF302 domain-containing protein [Rhizobiaceae bacterium]